MSIDHEVLVVGGGPAGSALATRLARAGRDVLLIDRSRFPRHKCCSEYGSPGTLAELERLGVLGEVERHGWTALTGTAVTAAQGSRLVGRFAAAGAATPTGTALPRHELDALLLAAARRAGATVREATALLDLRCEPDGTMHGIVAGPAGRTPMVARVVVGADGLGSRVARRAGLRRRGWLERVAFVAHVRGVTGLTDRAELHVGREGYVGLNPLDGHRTNVALVVPRSAARAARGDAAGFLAERLAGFPGVCDRVDLSRRTGDVMVSGPFDASCRRSTADGLLLVGDAADFFDPFTGEGICSALIGARLAAPVLDEALATAGPITRRRLAPYRRARLRQFLGKWTVERLIGYAMLRPALFDRLVARIERRGLGSTLINVTGHVLPARRVLNPAFLVRAVL
jgi:flavin-dependent dehydrogenase